MLDSVISAGAGLLGAVIGASATLLTTWLNKKMQTSGKIALYARIVHLPAANNQTWGFFPNKEEKLYMQVPVWLDVCNTSGISRIVRNVSLTALCKGKEIATFLQIQRYDTTKFGEDESYTLIIPANSAKRYSLLFMLDEKEIEEENKDFDELILTYFDEKDIIHSFHFAYVDTCWIIGALPREKKWITLKEM